MIGSVGDHRCSRSRAAGRTSRDTDIRKHIQHCIVEESLDLSRPRSQRKSWLRTTLLGPAWYKRGKPSLAVINRLTIKILVECDTETSLRAIITISLKAVSKALPTSHPNEKVLKVVCLLGLG
jgi:hypothetical protein